MEVQTASRLRRMHVVFGIVRSFASEVTLLNGRYYVQYTLSLTLLRPVLCSPVTGILSSSLSDSRSGNCFELIQPPLSHIIHFLFQTYINFLNVTDLNSAKVPQHFVASEDKALNDVYY